ncbi:LuxR C-terminal-related transcriptional regulator [Catenulispora subtropica]|uniref:LuxR family transcriptional regulator n=1 Tax=Catenulispora subtropica TaxID=450798 RepID=A0ABN2REP8_9ACTN
MLDDRRPDRTRPGDGLAGTTAEEIVYLELCRLETATTGQLSRALSLDRERTLRLLAGLHTRRLVRVAENGPTVLWAPVAPDVALSRVLNDREHAERHLREEITRLLDGYHRGPGRRGRTGAAVAEVVTGRGAIAQTWRALQAGARREVWVLDKPPFVQLDAVDPELEALSRGVAFRGVYERASLLLPGRLEQVRSLIAAGESGAVVPEVPFKLGIVDQRWALLPVAAGAELEEALVIRPSLMLDALVHSFQIQWAKAVPIPPAAGSPDGGAENQRTVDEDGAPGTHDLLTLLTAGLTDDAIARQLHISARTVQRRVRELMEELGARNRFQAGVQAARRGLL